MSSKHFVVLGFLCLLLVSCIPAAAHGKLSFSVEWTLPAAGPGDHGGRETPVLYDLDGDGYLEIVACTGNLLKVYDCEGTVLWERNLRGEADCVYPDWWGFVPAVGDLEGDGDPEIIVCSTLFFSASDPTCNPCLTAECPDATREARFHCFSSSGTLLWEDSHGLESAYTKPALADLNGDDQLEIIYGMGFYEEGGSFGGIIALLADGDILWTFETGNSVDSSPSVADIDRDGELEIVFGGEDGQLYVVGADGELQWSRRPSTPSTGSISCSPALADVNGDGLKEIFIGNDFGTLFAYDCFGTRLWYAEHVYNECIFARGIKSSPSVADLDGNGALEVIAGQGYHKLGGGAVFVSSAEDGGFVWDYVDTGAVWGSPCPVDLDSDGLCEVIVPMSDGKLVLLSSTGSVLDAVTFLDSGIWASPVVADIDRDGVPEVVISYGVDGQTPEWGLACLQVDGASVPTGGAPWPEYLHDSSNTNSYGTPASSAARFRVNAPGDVLADGCLHSERLAAGSADIAEWVEVWSPVEPGDVLEFGSSLAPGCRVTTSPCSPHVAGVVSSQPGLILGINEVSTPRTMLALAGIVPVKVTSEGGPILPGDLLVSSSTPGHAMRWSGSELCPCSLVGKALEPMAQELGVILVLLTAH